MLLTNRFWHRTLIDRWCVKKVVLLCDALYLPQFLDSQLITCESGVYLDIFPHSYVVTCSDPLLRKTKIGFVKIINMSSNAVTLNGLMAEEKLLEDIAFTVQPDVISFNIGMSDIKCENLAWNPNQIPKEYIGRFKDLIVSTHKYFLDARCTFADTLVYTFNMLPSYVHSDSVVHNTQPMEQVEQHSKYWGTSYYNIKREFARDVGNEINRRLHGLEGRMFDTYQVVLLNPTPRWHYQGLGVDLRSGLPFPTRHREILGIFLFSISRVCCEKRACGMGYFSSRRMREVDQQLTGGCTRIYQELLKQ